MTQWTDLRALRTALLKKWKSGTLLKQYVAGLPFTPLSMVIHGPTAQEVVEHLSEVRRWSAQLERAGRDGQVFRLETKRVGGAAVGYATLPARAHFETYAQAWELLGVHEEVHTVDELLRGSAQRPDVLDWIKKYPLKAIAHAAVWGKLLDAYDWLDWNRGQGKYVREVDAPGVDTKFIEQHRDMLAGMLGVSSSASGFEKDLGFARKPVMVRMRFDPRVFSLPGVLTEATFRIDEVAKLDVSPRVVLIIENEITYLSVPIPAGAVVMWGKGYDVAHIGSLPWLTKTRVLYWGDIDTHGLQILHRARTHLPHITSVMMDTPTLLAARESWGKEPKPTHVALDNLTETEAALYSDLVTDRFGEQLRLEQERIGWDFVTSRLRESGFLSEA